MSCSIREKTIFVDSGAFLALLDADDSNHAKAVKLLEKIEREGYPTITTNFVVAEAHALILSNLGANVAREWLTELSIPIWQVDKSEEDSAKEIIFKFKDKEYSLTDAISFVVMKKIGTKKAFAFDRHFKQFGYQFFE
ncbi:type II toxin-antitoxin system VapC family toxin [Candidatus Poribacteria bacterium]|nr:type II toxin-antitoxin system VapC family toxin [Candidatus Poribacteria bacterium]